MYIHTKTCAKNQTRACLYAWYKRSDTKKIMASGRTNFVDEITVSINQTYIDKHDVLNK